MPLHWSAKLHYKSYNIIFSSDRYPYFTANDDKWKNSVRHNLSMNPHFRKGNKSKHGAGHLWVLADFDEQEQSDGLQIKTAVIINFSRK